LKGRIGEVSGKLRFDIAPGSSVRVETGRAKNIPAADDQLAQNMYATVMQVSYLVNAEAGQAGTAFTLAHVRTESENKADATSVEKPPMYKRAWRGAPMIKGLKP
jgi:hypothetical protein